MMTLLVSGVESNNFSSVNATVLIGAGVGGGLLTFSIIIIAVLKLVSRSVIYEEQINNINVSLMYKATIYMFTLA